MPKNSLADLRNHLFEMIEKLKDDDSDAAEIEKAKAVVQLAGQIIDSAKVEVHAAEILGLEIRDGLLTAAPREKDKPRLVAGKANGEARQ